ncbi:MAG: pseudaminic acid cytidylyltransferase [Gemmatimonadaceae bacterium]|nr:pseudaminic acid cytidylyltransferase [Gemmatimonadaceae bacterium]
MADTRAVAIIPARGGSKRIPRKNIRPFLGVPLLVRTIQRLQGISSVSRVVVSTDDNEIADIARSAGAEVPFMRPATLADDHASTVPVVRDAVERLAAAGETARVMCAVYPAAVLLDTEVLAEAIGIVAQDATVDFAVPVTSFPSPIQRAMRRSADGRLEMFQPEHYESRSQDLEPAFHDVGQFYVGSVDAWLHERALFSSRTHSLVVPRWRVQDIDTPEDWTRAEQIAVMLGVVASEHAAGGHA